MTVQHEGVQIRRRPVVNHHDRTPLVSYLCIAGAVALLVSCYVFLACSSFIQNESLLYSLHASSVGVNISTTPVTCDLSKGEWVFDPQPPLYTNETCEYIQGHQNCMRNGRPDREFLNWRWQPHDCHLPRFNALVFLNLVRNKRMMFFGDSIARNHMQSLLCAVSQVEKPENVYRDPMDKDVIWSLPSYNFTLAIFWSPFLVKHQQKLVENGGAVMHIHLDTPEEIWRERLSGYDLVVISAGPWYFKPSVYYVNNEAIGCHHCPGDMNLTQLVFTDAYRAVLGNVFSFISREGGYTGMTFLRTFSMEHFQGGEWWNGGSCNRTRPFEDSRLELPWMASEMHRIQVEEFEKAERRGSENGSKVKLMDVTYSAFLRPDGHPGVYRSQKRDPQQGTVQSDCLHWCLPGPIDTWNEILLKIL